MNERMLEKRRVAQLKVMQRLWSLQGVASMPKRKFNILILVLIFSVSLAPLLMVGAASAQCTWMEGLSVVRAFNNANDYQWQGTWDPSFDQGWVAHYCSLGATSCSLREQNASAANDPPSTRPGVNNALRNETCSSAYDIDCCAADCPAVGHCCGPDVHRRVAVPVCCGLD